MDKLTTKRARWIYQTVADCFRLRDERTVTDLLKDKSKLEKFLEGEGPTKIFFYYQMPDSQGNDEIKDNQNEPILILNYGDTERLKDKGVWFLRMNPEQKINLNETYDNQVIWGEISQQSIPQLYSLMENVYYPIIDNMDEKEWGQTDEESLKEYYQHTKKFSSEVQEAVKLMRPGQELFKLEAEEYQKYVNSTNDAEKLPFYERKFAEWIAIIQRKLNDDQNQKKDPPDAGPEVEIKNWKDKMQDITNWSEQLKGKDFQMIKMYLQKQKQHEGSKRGDENISKLMIDYNRLDLQLTDKLNEAKDNVKYLSTLEKFLEPLYKGSPQQIIDTLPALMNAIKMIHTIARFYNTNDKMTGLFVKITNQMIRNCRERILAGGRYQDIWNRDPGELIQVLYSCMNLHKCYKECYKDTKEKIAEIPKGKGFDFPETQIFGKFETFVRRLQKLIDIFSNIQQFQALAKHNLEGMEKLTIRFYGIINEFKKKGHDLLDTNSNKFDRDWVEFNVEISHLDQELQSFIDNNFNRLRTIEYSLKLLKKFEATIKRDQLKHNLTTKYTTILHNYATELDKIQRIFTDQKTSPPIVRNIPPEAGKIIWARHLFQKITRPIKKFPEHLTNSQEIKKYYGSYNTLGKQLTIYEMWYYQNWVNEIERSKAALQATLIVRHDENKKLYVNFDIEILQLIREAKCLDRQGIEIPESARIILLQEDKFKMYHNELLYVLKEYERIISKIKPICKTLLGPHVEDLELKLRPGMVTLTWTSMNIDSYLQTVHSGLNKLEQLIITVNDIIENRIENNLKNISKVLLVSLPQESKPLTLDQFVGLQEEYIKQKTEQLMSKNVEVERAVDDLLQVIREYKLDPHVDYAVPDETLRIKRYYFWYLYQALLSSTQNSLNAMKYRVCGKKQGGTTSQQNNQAFKPFFEVDVQLFNNDVRLNPSLDDIQKAINRAATAVLRCSKDLYSWDLQQKDGKGSFYEMIAQDKEIVKVILLLTGSIQGTRNKVNEFLHGFNKFNWLWLKNIQDSIKNFSKGNPSLQEYEDALKKFSIIEEDIEKIESSHKIGAMELKTNNLSSGLKGYAKEWKNHYSQDLHKRARSLLDQLTDQTNNLSTKLSKEVKDIDSLGYVMECLEDIRKLQAEIDMKFNPVQDMYSLLDVYLPGGISDKDEMDQRTMLQKNWETLIQLAEIKGKELQQKQKSYLKQLKKSIKDFIHEVQEFRSDYEKNGPMVEGIAPKEAIERLRRFDDEFTVKSKFFQINKKGEDLFGLQNQKYAALEKTQKEIANLKKLYSLYNDVIETINNWKEEAWSEIKIDGLNQLEENVLKYIGQCQSLPRDLKEWQAYKELKLELDQLKDVLPLIKALKKDSIKPRHWQKIVEITGKQLNYEQPENLFIQDILAAKLLDKKEEIEDITDSADKQLKIEANLLDITSRWAVREFEFATWGKRDVLCMLKGGAVQEITETLEEDSLTLSSLNAQRQVAPFKPEVENNIRVFSDVQETLDMWVKVQKLWSSLEPVFTGGDIARQMPLQAKQFAAIDKNWIKIMEKAVESKKVIVCCQNDMLKDFLPDLQRKLEECQKMLEAYLEGKRKKFPRFYFVANQDLLKILSQGSDPKSIQEDFEKLFDAITKVTFAPNKEKKGGAAEQIITAIRQEAGNSKEEVELAIPVKCEGNIEGWLKQLEEQMQYSLREIARTACNACLQNPNLRDFCRSYCSQIALMGIQIIWTHKITEALEKPGRSENKNIMEQKRSEIRDMMAILSAMCLENYASSLDRTRIETLVTIHVHQRDIAQELKCKDINDFDWQKQTRLYWRSEPEKDTCIISITDWDQGYSYEFLGSKERLCITPLTDRCYITLAQAMSMYYGGAPAGPAGTGKTETVKDLGRTLGVFVVVTNCSDQHRYRDMAKIFKGLCQSGLWGCFDEFNRIDLEVLSVVAMQVEAITTAKKQHLKEFMFPEEPNPIELVQGVGYFITMNPGYAGRQELPENLKALFRGVSMMVPDREIIMKVKLASVGYNSIDFLAKKFNVLYKLCEEQLSKQRHYDFGLRNILSVLRTAGNTKREETKSDEEMLLMRSLRDMNLSKLVSDDIALFNGLLSDIFPKQTNIEKKTYVDIERTIPQVIQKKGGLISTPSFVLKIIQLYETALVRHGFMLVGPSGSGKTTIMELLIGTFNDLQMPHKIVRMNPKAITAQEMYGVKSEIADDWIPGVFSTIWQKSNNRSSKFTTWITCDGPVDAIWIENLNTVLDDNKILTLANGQRIPMTENCKLVFEVENLNNASPATVSRCGQVFVSATDLGFEPVWKGWIQARRLDQRAEESDKLNIFLNKYFTQYNIMDEVTKVCKAQGAVMDISNVLKVLQTLNLLNGVLRPAVQANKTLAESDYEKVVIYCLTWALGGVYEKEDRQLFHEYLASKGAPIPQKSKEGDTIFDYYIAQDDKGGFEWRAIVPEEWKAPERFQFSQLLMPTVDSFRAELLLNYILTQPKTTTCNNTVILVGGSGTAKTSSVLMYAAKFNKEKMLFKRINFSSATTPSQFQTSIETECEKSGKDYAPPQNKLMTVFVDDMSMPFVNKWGDQITLEIVRQLIDQGGFYMLDKAQRGNFMGIKNLIYIGAMQHPGGGRNDIPNRLKRQALIFNMILPVSVEGIYGPIIKHQFKAKYFTPEVNKAIETLTKATIAMWEKVKSTMLPTPAKFHYIFNMRDLSRIFKGILQVKKETINTSSQVGPMKSDLFLVGLWSHECERVFVDKMTNNKDKDQVLEFIKNISIDFYQSLENEILDKFAKDKTFLFCDFLNEDIKNEDGIIEKEGEKIYEAVNSMDRLRVRCNGLLKDYNEKYPSKKMELVLFDDAIRHLLRISRIIKQPRSNALLVGVGGSGKQSLTRLAADIGKQVCYQIVLTKNFSEKDLKEEIKRLFDFSGHLGKHVCFILTDSEVKKEEFLEYINMILSTGEIAGLLAKDEKEVWFADIRNDYVKEKQLGNVDPPQSDLYAYLIDRIRDNLHVVLCFSPVGQKFRDRSRKFPALFNECTIDWFLPWPEAALVSVAETFIKNFKELDTPKETKEELMKHMGNVHIIVNNVCDLYFQKMRRQVYVTPKSYISYLNAYKQLYIKKYGELDVQESSFKIGLMKIQEASVQIQQMEVGLREEEIKLKEASEKTEKLLEDLDKQQKKAFIKKEEVEATKAQCEKQANMIAIDKESAQKELAAAIPALERAQKAVDALEKKDIDEMKAMKSGLMDIMKVIIDTIVIYFGGRLIPIQPNTVKVSKVDYPFFKDSFDEGGKAILFDMGFLNKLKNFEKDQINEETIELLSPYFAQAQWFNEDKAKTASAAAAGLFTWVKAISEYHDKSKIVKPKRYNLLIQEGKLEKARKELNNAQKDLDEVDAFVAKLKETFNKQMDEKQQLEIRSNKTKKRITTARQLIESLTDEKIRWGKGATDIADQKKRLVGNCSLATSFISYCGPFNAEYRNLLSQDLFLKDQKNRGIPVTSGLPLTQFLVDDATVGEWNLQGLPKDELSIQNGIMVTNSSRYPLLIDPQGQGNYWIRQKYVEQFQPHCSVAQLNNPKFKDNFLKPCMANGLCLIIENIENEVDPMMDPILEKQIVRKSKTNCFIEVGGTQMDYDDLFRMFMFCRLANPSFSPELSAKTTIIDFTVTQGGLEQQLLGKVISKEQKALEDSLNQLLTDVNQNKKDLQRLDKNLLERLTQSTGNLLEDEGLIEVLGSTKTQAKEVSVKLADAEVKSREINEKREQYRPVAIRGSALYFTILEVSLINWMYNSSLEQFLKLFNESIDNSDRHTLPSKRVENIIKFLTFHVYKYVNRGLFVKDKISFILMMCFKIRQTDKKINSGDISIFLKSGAALDAKTEKAKPYQFLLDTQWLNIIALSRHHFNGDGMAFFKDLPDSIQRNEQQWKQWIEKNDPENVPIPDFAERITADKEIGAFIQLSLIRALREDRTQVASLHFINATLGKEFTEPITNQIESIYQESTKFDPVLYLLSAGADPTSSIDELSRKKRKVFCEKVSMGEGQEEVARKVIKAGFESGNWCILQNCHLGLKFMEEIETIITPDAVIHDDFRLWITCEQHPKFPLGLLQKTIKVTDEPPKGIKAGIFKTFNTIVTQEFLEKVEHPNWRTLLYTICFLHSIVIERKKFGPLGWCVPYEFNNPDLEASLAFIEKYLNTFLSGPPSQAPNLNLNMSVIRYMICEVQYGGRITDDLDRELFNEYGETYLKESIFGNEYVLSEAPMDGGGGTKPQKFQYKLPPSTNLPEIIKYHELIKSFPDIDNPEVFGLHVNADITFRKKESKEMIDTIMETRPKDSNTGAGKTREEIVQEKAKELQTKLPPDYQESDVRNRVRQLKGPKGSTDQGMTVPLNIFLYQELQRMQLIIGIVRKTLEDIVFAIDGTIIMTPDILDAINAIFDAKVPQNWVYDATGVEISWIYAALGQWFSSLLERNKQLNDWLYNNARPQVYWLTGFFNPQGFLTAVKQEVTRLHKKPGDKDAWSLDDVVYSTQVKEKDFDQIKDIQSEGVYIQGLFLEGCRWLRSALEESEPKKMFAPLPILYVTAINKKKSAEGDKGTNTYLCPVYKYPRRTDKYLIFRVALPCDGNYNAHKWKLRGVALLCSTE